jgi:hypothetical protein
MRNEKPIFIVGTGRCGSSIFHRILSEHPNISWLSILCNKLPNHPSINRNLMKVIDYPIAGRYLKKIIKPGECYDFWEHHCKGFMSPCRDLTKEDLTIKKKISIQNVMTKMLTVKRSRLLIKITGWPRITFLLGIFDDAKIIHIIRDGRAVANSLINVSWWHGWFGPPNWGWGELSILQKGKWEKHNKSFLALAAIEWIILMDAWEKAKETSSHNDILEIKYEDLCLNPLEIFKRVIEFCNLNWSKKIESSIQKKTNKIKNANYKWQQDLTANQKNILEDVMGPHLEKYGYL